MSIRPFRVDFISVWKEPTRSDAARCRYFPTVRGWAVKEISHQDVSSFESLRVKFDISPLILETPKKNESDDPMNLAKVRRMLKMKQ